MSSAVSDSTYNKLSPLSIKTLNLNVHFTARINLIFYGGLARYKCL